MYTHLIALTLDTRVMYKGNVLSLSLSLVEAAMLRILTLTKLTLQK